MSDYKLYNGDCLDVMKELPDNYFHACVSDPPYGLNFMGKNWDNGVPGEVYWKELLRVCRPGSHILIFGGTRTHHRLMVAIEDAGWEIRDCIAWHYSSGFPKSLDISKELDRVAGIEREVISTTKSGGYKRLMTHNAEDGFRPTDYYPDGNHFTSKEAITDEAKEWDGWGTGLKPSFEPIILARKPISEKNVAANILKWGTGAININVSRIPTDTNDNLARNNKPGNNGWKNSSGGPNNAALYGTNGRWPANTILDESITENLPWSKFFYCSKASKKERDYGLESFDEQEKFSKFNTNNGSSERFDGAATPKVKNNHPTVKPQALLSYLCSMITPPNGIILDPFVGSGSTLVAAINLGFDCVGIDKEEEYINIANARCTQAVKDYEKN